MEIFLSVLVDLLKQQQGCADTQIKELEDPAVLHASLRHWQRTHLRIYQKTCNAKPDSLLEPSWPTHRNSLSRGQWQAIVSAEGTTQT